VTGISYYHFNFVSIFRLYNFACEQAHIDSNKQIKLNLYSLNSLDQVFTGYENLFHIYA